MLLTVVTYHLCVPNACRFLEQIEERGVRTQTRAEPGNKGYDFFFSAASDMDILLIEKWENQVALEHHKQQKAFFDLQEIKAAFGVSVEGEIYQV